MIVRLLALLVAVLVMAGVATAGSASSDPRTSIGAALAIDDAPDALDLGDLGPAILPVPIAVPGPSRRAPVRASAPRSLPRGRMHAVLVFRPPRRVASR